MQTLHETLNNRSWIRHEYTNFVMRVMFGMVSFQKKRIGIKIFPGKGARVWYEKMGLIYVL